MDNIKVFQFPVKRFWDQITHTPLDNVYGYSIR